ncbi:MAG: hypothetical protein LBS54_00550 [Dysgonamonadaceae bacterium]|nr:hypothetical protein [Dysgonamonadaceae bacterium]
MFLAIVANHLPAQETVTQTKHKTWDLHALRYYPFSYPADDFIAGFIDSQKDSLKEDVSHEGRTSLDLVIYRPFLENMPAGRVQSVEDIAMRFFLKFYGQWMIYARPADKDLLDIDLSLFLYEKSGAKSVFPFIEQDELRYFLDEWTGTADFKKDKNEILSMSYKNPICNNALKTYRYFFSGETVIDSIPALEIAFFSRKPEDKAFEGFLYFSKQDTALIKAVFTLNYLNKNGIVNNILFQRKPSCEEDFFYIGNDAFAGLVLKKQRTVNNDSLPPKTQAQQALPDLIITAEKSRAYRNLQRTGMFVLNHKLGIAGDKIELGPLTHTLSVNDMEGYRFRVGANTTELLNSKIQTGGYLAYGSKDKNIKFRGDLTFSFSRNDRLNLSLVKDLNIPGRNIFDDDRDLIYKSIKTAASDCMTLQKAGYAGFEKALFNNICFVNLSAKYVYDEPKGLMHYVMPAYNEQKIRSITTFETAILLRYAPGEKYIRVRGNKYVFRQADIDVRINQRFGIKGVLDSEYNYRITDFSAAKRIILPWKVGSLDVCLSGGKVWDRVPFPLLFIPKGSQSRFVYAPDEFNLLHLYEGVSDRFLAGNMNLTFNFSPVTFFYPKSIIQTNVGLKSLYGSLSDNNNPTLHDNLFDFQGIISPMGNTPYLEGNIGLGNILHVLRVDYVYRFGASHRGAVLVSLNFSI